jgi:hypothetical protein
VKTGDDLPSLQRTHEVRTAHNFIIPRKVSQPRDEGKSYECSLNTSYVPSTVLSTFPTFSPKPMFSHTPRNTMKQPSQGQAGGRKEL